ncbi:putative L-type lectin-domain containing receptor kinase S.5 [Prunus yedoensis var. nudiflora]|uniref:Putative L-type lectin-domain containing receptor kinase S.5 n=1 Tax=Prunus yedoensis var. nudiflora TaxID=2094558 RepID=A0A315ABQ0_PRUYE|nr:putative L-type lectin-domain containing receptor kinase S.5 [Prunus yedoensis var. nudiflora]
MGLPKGILITFLVVPFAIMLHQAAIGTAESAAKPKDFLFVYLMKKLTKLPSTLKAILPLIMGHFS